MDKDVGKHQKIRLSKVKRKSGVNVGSIVLGEVQAASLKDCVRPALHILRLQVCGDVP
jgi:hypothetical protein